MAGHLYVPVIARHEAICSPIIKQIYLLSGDCFGGLAMTIHIPNVQVCDAKGDAQRSFSPAYKICT